MVNILHLTIKIKIMSDVGYWAFVVVKHPIS
jgi:hypothetical protein